MIHTVLHHLCKVNKKGKVSRNMTKVNKEKWIRENTRQQVWQCRSEVHAPPDRADSFADADEHEKPGNSERGHQMRLQRAEGEIVQRVNRQYICTEI